MGIDSNDKIAFGTKVFGEVGDLGGLVIAAEEDLVFGDLAAAGSGGGFFDQVDDAYGVVFQGKGGLEDVAVTVTDEGDVLAFGIVEGNAEDLAGVPGTFENGADESVLITIDGLDFAYWFAHGIVKIPCLVASIFYRSSQASLSPNGIACLLRTT